MPYARSGTAQGSWRDRRSGADRTPLTTDLDLGYELAQITHPAMGMPRHVWTWAPAVAPELSWHCPELRAVGPIIGPTSMLGSFESCL